MNTLGKKNIHKQTRRIQALCPPLNNRKQWSRAGENKLSTRGKKRLIHKANNVRNSVNAT